MATLPDIVEATVTRRLRGVHTAAVGTISDHADNLCTVTLSQPLDGAEVEPLPLVPVAIAGDWQDGDPCLVVFCEEEFDSDLAGTDETKRHGLSGAVCVPLVARPGDSGQDFVALAGLVISRLEDMQSQIDSHVHTVPISGPAGVTPSGPALSVAPATPILWPTSGVAATRLRGR